MANIAGFNRKLTSLLRRHELISAEELVRLSDQATADHKPLSSLIVEEDYLDELTILGLISEDCGMPTIDLDKLTIDTEQLKERNGGQESISESAAKRFLVMPLAICGEFLTLAVSDPYDVIALDDIKLQIGKKVLPVVSSERAIRKAIEVSFNAQQRQLDSFIDSIHDDADLTHKETSDNNEEEQDDDLLNASGKDSPAVKLVNMIIAQAIQQGASDIHIEPFERRTRIRLRVDGVLHEVMDAPKKLEAGIVSRIKIMTDTMNIAEKGKPQDGRFQMRYAGRSIDFRVNSLPTVHGEKVVMRLLDKGNLAGSLESLNFEPHNLNIVHRAIKAPFGMLLVTGPTGSGKSTTLYSCLQSVMTVEDNVSTVEEPVEYEIEGLNQVHVNPKRGLTFASALRALLRQDPDTIMIGEIRDSETVEIAVKAALTGHLVLSTLHTNDAPSTINRLIDMGVEPFLVANTVLAVLAQRLGRRLCKACKRQIEPDKLPSRDLLLETGFTAEEIDAGLQVFEPVGCSLCAGGYKGRFAMVEALEMSNALRSGIVKGISTIELRELAVQNGMITLRRAGLLQAMRGVTSIEEVERVTMGDES